MSSTRGLVASTVPLSVVDGPGSRFVLFMQGCNFDCTACHNPSTIELHPGPEVARQRSVSDVLEEIRRSAPFLSGVTVTGGEPTLQLDFLIELFGAIKADPDLSRLTILVDTNGTLPPAHWERLAPMIDGAMVDLKAFSPELHLELTGKGNHAVMESIRWLHAHAKLTEVRLLVIEGVTDDPDELKAWAGFVGGVNPGIRVRLMGFRHLGTRGGARVWDETTDEVLERTADILRNHGLTEVHPEVASTAIGVSRLDPLHE